MSSIPNYEIRTCENPACGSGPIHTCATRKEVVAALAAETMRKFDAVLREAREAPEHCSKCGAEEDKRFRRCISCGAPYDSRVCDICETTFAPRSGSQRFCSARCRNVIYKPASAPVPRPCVVCRGEFTPDRAAQTICSISCRRAYQRSRSRERLNKRDPYLGAILNDPCVYCGGRSTGFDHIIPKAEGGGDDWTNLTPCCGRCNSSKRVTPLLLFLCRRPLGRAT